MLVRTARQEPNQQLEGLRIKVLEDHEMSNQGTECGLQLVDGDVMQLLLEVGAPYGAVRIPEQLDDSLGGRVLQRPGDPVGPAVVNDVETQCLIEAEALWRPACRSTLFSASTTAGSKQ